MASALEYTPECHHIIPVQFCKCFREYWFWKGFGHVCEELLGEGS